MIIVDIALAIICFTNNGINECHPILVGKNSSTPVGEFSLRRRITTAPGYGGDVLQFYETLDEVYAIHRLWLLKPEQKRLERLKSNNIKDRYISSGCVNVDPVVYSRIIDCCIDEKLIIK